MCFLFFFPLRLFVWLEGFFALFPEFRIRFSLMDNTVEGCSDVGKGGNVFFVVVVVVFVCSVHLSKKGGGGGENNFFNTII